MSPQFFHGKKSVAGSGKDKAGKEGIKRHSLTWAEGGEGEKGGVYEHIYTVNKVLFSPPKKSSNQ